MVDTLGTTPLLLVVERDGESVRAFDRTVDDSVLDLYLKADTDNESPLMLIDAQTGSEWNFAGQAVAGPLTGKKLRRIQTLLDFWFDWKIYHPETQVYDAGLQPLK